MGAVTGVAPGGNGRHASGPWASARARAAALRGNGGGCRLRVGLPRRAAPAGGYVLDFAPGGPSIAAAPCRRRSPAALADDHLERLDRREAFGLARLPG